MNNPKFKNMKTRSISILAVLLLTVAFATAQEMGKSSFGILGGVNFQNLNGKDYTGDKLENDMKVGYHIGINMQVPVAPEFYFQPGLLLSTKGAIYNGNSTKTTTSLTYIELPLNFVYKGLLGPGYVFIGAGPYLGYGIGGKVNIENGSDSNDYDVEFTNVVEITDPLMVSYYKAFDAGGNIFFGYEMAGGIFAQFNAQLGMVNISPEYKILPDDESLIKNTGFGLSLGYRF
jgi:hypothetical protein